MERQSEKRRHYEEDWFTESRMYNKREKTEMVGHVVGMEDSTIAHQVIQWDLIQEKAGWTSSIKISRTWTLPGKKLKNWQQTQLDGLTCQIRPLADTVHSKHLFTYSLTNVWLPSRCGMNQGLWY